MRALRRTLARQLGSYKCEPSHTDAARLRADSFSYGESAPRPLALCKLASCRHPTPSAPSFERTNSIDPSSAATSPTAATLPTAAVLSGEVTWPTAPTLEGVLVDPATAALAELHKPLLRSWWQAAYIATLTGALHPDEIASQDFAAMQRVMGLAMVETMQRRWMSGCGPASRLALPQMDWLSDEANAALAAIHKEVVTRSSPHRERFVADFVSSARAHIIAGEVTEVSPKAGAKAQSMAIIVFKVATAGALAARATQTTLLGVFWQMLENHGKPPA